MQVLEGVEIRPRPHFVYIPCFPRCAAPEAEWDRIADIFAKHTATSLLPNLLIQQSSRVFVEEGADDESLSSHATTAAGGAAPQLLEEIPSSTHAALLIEKTVSTSDDELLSSSSSTPTVDDAPPLQEETLSTPATDDESVESLSSPSSLVPTPDDTSASEAVSLPATEETSSSSRASAGDALPEEPSSAGEPKETSTLQEPSSVGDEVSPQVQTPAHSQVPSSSATRSTLGVAIGALKVCSECRSTSSCRFVRSLCNTCYTRRQRAKKAAPVSRSKAAPVSRSLTDFFEMSKTPTLKQ